ncbi:hypothetical protein Tco_0733138 [Tanacetum coccineum]
MTTLSTLQLSLGCSFIATSSSIFVIDFKEIVSLSCPRCSYWTTSAIKLMALSSRAVYVAALGGKGWCSPPLIYTGSLR